MTKLLLAVAAAIALSAFGLSGWILIDRLTQEKTISGEGVIAVPANTNATNADDTNVRWCRIQRPARAVKGSRYAETGSSASHCYLVCTH